MLMRTVLVSVDFVLKVSASACSKVIWIFTGSCDIFFVSLAVYTQIPIEIFSLQGLFIAFVSFKILVILVFNVKFPQPFISCLEGNCTSAEPCFMQRTCSIFSCPKSNLSSTEEYITFEEWVAQDITDDYDPLRQEHEHVEIHGVPPPKRVKHIWKKVIGMRFYFLFLFVLLRFIFNLHSNVQVLNCSSRSGFLS